MRTKYVEKHRIDPMLHRLFCQYRGLWGESCRGGGNEIGTRGSVPALAGAPSCGGLLVVGSACSDYLRSDGEPLDIPSCDT